MEAAQSIRKGIIEAADSLDQAGDRPERPPAFTYVPPSHARALHPDATLVEGIRGAGKSFWWAQLASPKHREFIKTAYPEARLGSKLKVARGFGNGLSVRDAPDAEILASLVARFKSRSIWRAVLALHAEFDGFFASLTNWEERVTWVEAHPEEYALLLEQADRKLEARDETLLVLFDALDRLADTWPDIHPLAQALLRVGLDVRSTRRIRFKLFVRPDILQDKAVTAFPDYSKLLAYKADLSWRRADLYALFFQCLVNSLSGGAAFRKLISEELDMKGSKTDESWLLPPRLRTDEELQEKLFIQLAGKAMGATTKRGKPYTWLVNHLQDGLNQVSPRSFFAALKTAAQETPDDHLKPLDYKGIQAGVQRASKIRVQEITGEDYPWVGTVMEPFKGRLSVPCGLSDMAAIWEESETQETLKAASAGSTTMVKLPPLHLHDGSAGIAQDLEALGLIQTLTDGRIQMPDVYRIAFGLGRRGGVKPLR
ncbi:MAG: hypothetical protein PHU46_04825 [Rhodocyclaceae bacterium]|nr:hypothetical protein [Rhodocyclaceae bacterium]